MSFTNYTNQALLAAMFGKTSNFGTLSSAPTIYVGLSSTAPAEDGSNITEPSTGSYARVATAASDWNAPTLADPSVIDNANAVTFPQATGDWLSQADIGYFFLADGPAGSPAANILGSGSLDAARKVLNGDTPEFGAGDLNATLD